MGTHEDEAEWQRRIATAYAVGNARWPGIKLDERDFADYARTFDRAAILALRLDDKGDGGDSGDDTTSRLAELYLVAGCARMSPEAMAIFDRELIARVPQFVRRLDGGAGFGDEIAQLVRVKLFLGEDGPGKIAGYTGRGQLDSWVCAVAIRTALSVLRGRSDVRPPPPDDLAPRPEDDPDPGLFDLGVATQVLLRQHADEFRVALREAMTALPAPDRNLLRFYYVDRLTLQQIGELRGAHAATIMRRLRQIRGAVASDIRQRLRARLDLSTDDLASLERDMVDYVDVSMSTMLAESAASD